MARAVLPLLFLVSGAIANGAYAADSCPQMSPSEIGAQWERYASRSSAKPVNAYAEYDCLNLEAGAVVLICRTKAGSAAHPSIVVGRVRASGGSVQLVMDGHTAGNCAAFQEMMNVFRQTRFDEGQTNNGESVRP